MDTTQLNKSRFTVGIFLVVIAAAMFLFFNESVATAGAIAIGILGLVSIAISRRK